MAAIWTMEKERGEETEQSWRVKSEREQIVSKRIQSNAGLLNAFS